MTHYNCYRYSNVVCLKSLLKCMAIRLLLLITVKFFAVLTNEPKTWLTTVAILTDYCRRFDQWLSPFWPKFFAVLTNGCRRFDQCLSPFWLMVVAVLTRVVAVLTRVVAVLECRRFGMSPFLLSPFRLVAVMTGTRHLKKPSWRTGQLLRQWCGIL